MVMFEAGGVAGGWALSRQIRNPNSAPAFFITFFLYGPHRHPTATFAIIPRECSIENCARLQRRTHHPPQNHFPRLFDNVKTSSRSGNARTPKTARQIAESTPKSLFM